MVPPKFRLIKPSSDDSDFMDEHDVIGGSMEAIDPEVQEFLDNYINSFLKLDIIKFFFENPSAMDTPPNIAKYVGRNEEDILPALDDLSQKEILLARTLNSGSKVYTFQPSRKMKRLTDRFMHLNSSQEGRFQTVTHLLKLINNTQEG